jgi:hypothetical protein
MSTKDAGCNRLAALERALQGPLRWSVAAFALGVLPYLHTVGFAFAYDDEWTIVGNRALDEPLGALMRASWSGASARTVPDATRPLMLASTWLDVRLFGRAPFGHHLTSVLLHGLLVVAAAWAARALLRSRRAALLTAALVSLAPGHAEATAAVNYREDLLAPLFVFAAFAALAQPRRRALPAWVEPAAAAAWLLALLSKESALALVPMVAVLALSRPHPLVWLARRERLLFWLLAVLAVWANWRWALWLGGDLIPQATLKGPGDVATHTARYFGWTLVTSLTGWGTSPAYDGRGAAPLWGLIVAAVGLAGLVVALRRPRLRWPALGLALLVAGAAGASPLFRPINERADRYLVMASLGAALAVTVGAGRLFRRRRAWAVAGLGVVAFAWAAACARDTLVWRSDRTVWTAATERQPTSPKAWVGLALAERHDGNFAAAHRALDRALEADADYPPAHVSRVYLFLLEDKVVEAERELQWTRLLPGDKAPGFQRASVCVTLEREARLSCARGEALPPQRDAGTP